MDLHGSQSAWRQARRVCGLPRRDQPVADKISCRQSRHSLCVWVVFSMSRRKRTSRSHGRQSNCPWSVSRTSGALEPGNGSGSRRASGRWTHRDLGSRVVRGRYGKVLRKIRGEGEGHTPSDRPLPVEFRRADTAVPPEPTVVFGHAYAIPALCAISDDRCGYDKPTSSSADGVDTSTLGPGATAPGPS